MADDGTPFPPMSPADVAELTDEQQDKQNELKQAGVELLEDGKDKEALEKFSEAIAIGCASALLYSRRAAILWKLGRTNAVINDCTAALAVNPDSAKAYKMRGRAKAKLEKWEEANLDFQTGLKIDHDDETEDESKVAAAKAKAIKEAAVQERVQKEKDDYEIKLLADKKAYQDAMKARAEIWTDDKEQKYQETCKKAEQEKKRKENKAKEEAEKKAAAEAAEAEKKTGENAGSGDGTAPKSEEATPASPKASGGYSADAPEKVEASNSEKVVEEID